MSGSAGWWRSSATASGTGIINKTKQKHNRKTKRRNQAQKESQGRWSCDNTKKKSDSLLVGYYNFFLYILSSLRSWRHPGVTGVFEEGPLEEHRERDGFFFFLLLLSVKMLQSCVQSIPSLTGCERERRGAADVTGPRDALSYIP